MQKKGIILLITLFFISSISLLIIKNLGDSEKFMQIISYDTVYAQLKLTTQNVQEEITEFASKHKDDIDDIIEYTSLGIPFNYGDINLTITLEHYTFKDCNLNDVKTVEDLNNKCSEDTVNNILYQYDFIELRNKKIFNTFSNQKQINYFIDTYTNYTRDDRIQLVKNDFEYIKEDENKTYLECNYDMTISDVDASSKFVFELDSKDIKSFELLLTD